MKRLIIFDVASLSVHIVALFLILHWTWPGFLFAAGIDLFTQILLIGWFWQKDQAQDKPSPQSIASPRAAITSSGRRLWSDIAVKPSRVTTIINSRRQMRRRRSRPGPHRRR